WGPVSETLIRFVPWRAATYLPSAPTCWPNWPKAPNRSRASLIPSKPCKTRQSKFRWTKLNSAHHSIWMPWPATSSQKAYVSSPPMQPNLMRSLNNCEQESRPTRSDLARCIEGDAGSPDYLRASSLHERPRDRSGVHILELAARRYTAGQPAY